MFKFSYQAERSEVRRRTGQSRRLRFQPLQGEFLESRHLLASGPYIHIHDANQLGVIDATTGEVYKIGNLSVSLSDIGFHPQGRLFGISSERLYEIHPGTAALTDLGTHGISGANGMVFQPDGRLLVMARSSNRLYTITDVTRPSQSTSLVLPSLGTTEGSNGDISVSGTDLFVAATNGSLMRFGFDIEPNRPRLISQTPLGRTDIVGLAAIGPDSLFGLSDNSVIAFNLSGGVPVQREVNMPTQPVFGDLRGAAYYAESGTTLPVGTLSGVHWRDDNQDGVRQVTEPFLENWVVYVDRNLNGLFDVGEPKAVTDAQGRYLLFGNAPGLHTVDQIVADTTNFSRSWPRTEQRHLVADYDFEDSSGRNQLNHAFGLPALLNTLVSFNGDDARLTGPQSYLELPVALGQSPFTILIDGTYQPVLTSTEFLVSQRSAVDAATTSQDFALYRDAGSPTVRAAFCTSTGNCVSEANGTLDAQRHQWAISWDGRSVGIFADNSLITRAVATTGLPDIDGVLLRFGRPVTTGTSGTIGSLHGIRIFNRSLSEVELRNGFSTPETPTAYSVYLPPQSVLNQLNFGNLDRRIPFNAEIEVRRDGPNGTIIETGSSIDLGTIPATGPAPQITFVVRNLGQSNLQIPSITVPPGYVLSGTSVGNLASNQSLSFTVRLTDLSVGTKSGSITIQNNDANESPFLISLSTQVGAAGFEGNSALVLDSEGRIWQLDPDGSNELVASGLPTSLRDIAQHPAQNGLYAIDATHVYQIQMGATPASATVSQLFAHGITNPTALGFSNTNQLFAAGSQVFRINLSDGTKTSFGSLGINQASDFVTIGGQNYVSTDAGLLFRLSTPAPVSLGSMSPTFTGLANVSSSTVLGFTNRQAYLVDIATRRTTASYLLPTTTIVGATTALAVINGQNPQLATDVNADLSVSPIDALLIINELNSPQFIDASGRLVRTPVAPTRYPDVNGDGFVSPIDAITIINQLNSQAAARAEMAEAESDATTMGPSQASNRVVLADLALAALWSDDRHERRPFADSE